MLLVNTSSTPKHSTSLVLHYVGKWSFLVCHRGIWLTSYFTASLTVESTFWRHWQWHPQLCMPFLPHPPRNHPAQPAKLVTVTLTVVFLYLLATYKILGQQAFPLAIRIHDGMAIQLATVNFCFRVAIYTSVLASNPSFPFKILYQAQLWLFSKAVRQNLEQKTWILMVNDDCT